MLQYENYTNNINSNGPQKANIFSNIIVYHEQLFHSTLYHGKSVIVPQDQATIENIKKLLAITIDSIIIVLNKEPPHKNSIFLSPIKRSKESYNIISRYGFELIYYESLKIQVPIYFVKGEEFSKLIKSAGKNVAPERQDEYKLIVSSGLPNVIINPFAYNFQGILRGDADQLKSNQYYLPTIVILASYDSFHIIPALSGEFANNGNAFVVFELARIFSKLYSNKSTKALYNIVFALTGASSLNEYGVKRWIDQQPSLISETIEFVLCIDSIGIGNRNTKNHNDDEDDEIKSNISESRAKGATDINENTLYIQMSRSPKLSTSIIDTFKNAGSNQGKDSFQTEINIVHRKINIADKNIYWKHEVFTKKKIFAFTVTQKPSPSILSRESTILYNKENNGSSTLDLKTLKKNTRIIASALISHIYNKSNIIDYSELLKESLDVNLHSFEEWKQVFSNTNLMFPFIHEKTKQIGISNLFSSSQQQNQKFSSTISDQLNNNRIDIISGIYAIFETYLQEFKMDKFNTDNSLQFYQPTQEILKFYRVKSFSFDFLHINFTILYLVILYFIIKDNFKTIVLNLINNGINNNNNNRNNNNNNYNSNTNSSKKNRNNRKNK